MRDCRSYPENKGHIVERLQAGVGLQILVALVQCVGMDGRGQGWVLGTRQLGGHMEEHGLG